MSFSENLYELRKKEGLSQEEFAEKIDVSRQTVSKWEMGQTTPEMDKLILISKLFNVSLDELTENVVNNNYSKEHFSNKTKKDYKVIKIIIVLLIIYLAISIYKFIALSIMNKIGSDFSETSYNIMIHRSSSEFSEAFNNNILKVNNKVLEKSYSSNPNRPHRVEYIDIEKRERYEIVLEDEKYFLIGSTEDLGNEEEINNYFNSFENSNYFRDIAGNYKYSFSEKLKMSFNPFSIVNIFSKRITIIDPFKTKAVYEYNNDYLLIHTTIKDLQTEKIYETTISYDYVQEHFANQKIENPLNSGEYGTIQKNEE